MVILFLSVKKYHEYAVCVCEIELISIYCPF